MKNFLGMVGACSFALGFMALTSTAQAGECVSGQCGTPQQSGGGCGCGCGSILVAMTDRGDTYQFADDQDGDGIEDEFDNCAFKANYDQSDSDGDTVGDLCDNCAVTPNQDQRDMNGNQLGDLCDNDLDGDTILNDVDNCRDVPNLAQTNTDGDVQGDMCDADDDNDGFPDLTDSCRLLATGSGPECDDDPDGDGVPTLEDNCPSIANFVNTDGVQADMNGDGVGDACDLDLDGDGLSNWKDNCVGTHNPSQIDFDNDGVGDAGVFDGTGESCDTSECYVIDRDNPADCLDPRSSFQIKLALAGVRIDGSRIQTGDTVDVRIFTNRLNTLHQWQARFEQLPEDSDTSLLNAMGSAATYAGTFQVGSDPEISTIRFRPDVPGKYVVKVTASLPQGDALGSGSSSMSITADVGGEPQGGCASAGAQGGLAALVFGLGALTALRRRRS